MLLHRFDWKAAYSVCLLERVALHLFDVVSQGAESECGREWSR